MGPKFDPDRKLKFDLGDGAAVEFKLGKIMVPPGKRISLAKDYDPGFTGGSDGKKEALRHVADNVARLSELQDKLYAQDTYGVLVIFQAMDAAGKDGAIRHVMSGVNPQGCHVTSFKVPSTEELDHDYLWRAANALPARGMIGIFNRSYYEEVLVVRVHPELLAKQHLPPESGGKSLWNRRFAQINAFEKYLAQNGIVVVKFFLNVSRDEQKKRLVARIDRPEKNWKFSVEDVKERAFWDDYQAAYEDALNHTSTKSAPWYVVPADNKWFARLTVSEVLCTVLERLELAYPVVGEDRKRELQEIRAAFEHE
jgi:PPK2 family polyphosphate:nucleotide phosphotransferase